MVFARITGFLTILFGIFIGVSHFGFLPNTIFGFNFVTIGILVFIVHELFALFMNISHDGNKIIGVGVPLLFAIVAGSYFLSSYLPAAVASNILLIISVLMVAEGLYRMH